MELIVHGCGPAFDMEKFNPITSRSPLQGKPNGGLWASPVDSDYGWKKWCQIQSFNLDKLSESFEIGIKGNIYKIDNKRDLLDLPLVLPPRFQQMRVPTDYPLLFHVPDFKKILSDGIDAIHLTEKGECCTRLSEPNLYGWDCECVLILNKDCIKVS